MAVEALSAVADVTNHVNNSLAKSKFFAGLKRGTHSIEHVRAVFSQYYLWRNQFHRWFGVCIAKSPAFGTSAPIEYVLSELTEHIEEEIKGDHHGMCKTFLKHLGVTNLAAIKPLAITTAYCDSFITRYISPSKTGEEALAALAGRELVAPARNRISIDTLSANYSLTEGLEFFTLHEELEVEHFKGLWEAVTKDYPGDTDELVKAAKDEITLHVKFWDDVSAAL
jgi:pyrroloquinoline quinone (PQQ) biosynthesis protein C